jgi:hypothetical protein
MGGSCTGEGDHVLEGKGSHESSHEITVMLTLQEKIEKAREDMYACVNSETPLKKVHFVLKIRKNFDNKRTNVLHATVKGVNLPLFKK